MEVKFHTFTTDLQTATQHQTREKRGWKIKPRPLRVGVYDEKGNPKIMRT